MFCRIFGFALLAGLFVSSTAQAQFGGYQPYRPGTSFYSGPDGLSSVTRIGQTDFYSFPDGRSATAQRIGNHTFLHSPQGSSTITDIGGQRFYQGPGSLNGTSQQFGNQRMYNFSNGTTGTVRNWGGFSTYDFSGPGNRNRSGIIMPIGGAPSPWGP